MNSNSPLDEAMTPRERADYVVARTKDAAFDAVCALWKKRQAEGMTQSQLAEVMASDEGWVSRNLSGPGNWTIKTLARFVAGLNGEVEIVIHDLSDVSHDQRNFDAYDAINLSPSTSCNIASQMSLDVSPQSATTGSFKVFRARSHG